MVIHSWLTLMNGDTQLVNVNDWWYTVG